jgi:hypothetical protein
MLTLATCSYNTPDVTVNMINSYRKFHGVESKVIMTDNSTNEETIRRIPEIGYRLEIFRNPGFHHSIGVDFLIEHCKTKYMLLVDTDVLFLQSIDSLFDKFKQSGAAIGGVKQGSRGGLDLYDRIVPWFCFIDIEQIKKHNIKFFDQERFSQHLKCTGTRIKIYDVGATFYEDIFNAGLNVMEISEAEQNQYIKHYEGMSWRKYSGNKGLIDLANKTEQEYYTFLEIKKL